ncbi:MAG: response regulator [Cyclobacteriaceae bacterium]
MLLFKVNYLNQFTPDLIFLDIHLSDGSGFEIFEQIKVRSPIIFTTAYDEYALKAFEVNSIDYLLKPIGEENLKKSLEKFKAIRNKHPQDIE